jgi:hypothetical protein
MVDRADELRSEIAEREIEMAERDALEQSYEPDWSGYSNPSQMPDATWRAWMRAGHPPLPLESKQLDADEVLRRANECAVAFTPANFRRALRPFLAHVGRYVRETVAREVKKARREAIREARAEVRRAMNADDTVVHLKDLRRHG